MWNLIQHSSLFFLKFSQNEIYEIYITDYINIWSIYFSKLEFLSRLKDSNRNLEIREDDLIWKGKEMLRNPQKLKGANLDLKEDNRCLDITMKMSFGHLLKLQMKLSKGSNELIFREITLPLLKMTQDLKVSQEELCKLLKKKDNEIEEYKCEGGEIALRCLRTVIFDEKAHMNNHKTYEEYFGSSGISKYLLEKTVNVPNVVQIKREFIKNDNEETESNSIIKTEIIENPISETQSMPTTTEAMVQKTKTESDTPMVTPQKKQRRGKKLNL